MYVYVCACVCMCVSVSFYVCGYFLVCVCVCFFNPEIIQFSNLYFWKFFNFHLEYNCQK